MTPNLLDPSRAFELYELPSDQCYLLAHSLGCQPKQSRESLNAQVLEVWAQDPQQAWPQWMQSLERFREALATFLGGKSDQYCPQVNVSSAFSKTLGAAWPEKKTRTLLLSEADFPSLGFVAQCAQKQGWKIEWLASELDHCELAVWADAIHPGIDAVLATHVQYSTNRRSPIEGICKLARERGILSIVDVCQSAGVVPLDFVALDAGVVVGSCIKWLCGGPGAGFMWVNPSPVCALEPVDVGWFSHQNPFEFEIHNFRYAQNADRFFGGTPSVFPFVAATVGIETLERFGIDAISAHNRKLSKIIREAVPPELLLSDEDPNKRGGTTVIALSPEDPRVQALRAQGFAFDARKFGIRLSPHIYTQRSEIERLADLLRDKAC